MRKQVNGDIEVVFTPWPYDAVARGVALLDEKVPGWRERIKAAALRMEDCDQCVLGQVFGSYGLGIDKLDLSDFAGGFELPAFLPHWMSDAEGYRALTTAWREAIVGGSK